MPYILAIMKCYLAFCLGNRKIAQVFFAHLQGKCGLLKTHYYPFILTFTFVNSKLRNISNDKVTLNCLIINILRCHLSFVTFAFTLSLQ